MCSGCGFGGQSCSASRATIALLEIAVKVVVALPAALSIAGPCLEGSSAAVPCWPWLKLGAVVLAVTKSLQGKPLESVNLTKGARTLSISVNSCA